MSERPRLFFLDNLRAFVIVMVIVLHASITYMAYPPEWWYVLDPDRSDLFTMLVLLVDVPLMPALFFVAGYFALPSLERRGGGGFIREKIVRLAIPWGLGVFFLAPLATYMTYVSRDVPMGYLEFWTTDFWGRCSSSRSTGSRASCSPSSSFWPGSTRRTPACGPPSRAWSSRGRACSWRSSP
jgi:fucose 4-O-acetylase-like acetyltransferase